MSDDFSVARRAVLRAAGAGAVVGLGQASATATGADAVEPGELLWEFDTGDPVKMSSPTVVDGTVYIGAGAPGDIETEGGMYAVNADTGDQEWAFDGAGQISASPTMVDGTVHVGSEDGTFYALDADSGTQEWEFDADNGIDSSLTVVDGIVYTGTAGFQDGSIHAIDTGTGEEVWTFDGPKNSVRGSPTVWQGSVYVGSSDENLYARDATTGEEVWTFDADGRLLSSPTVADGVVYVGTKDGYLHAVDATTGEEVWTYQTPTSVFRSSPTVSQGVAYVGDAQGHVSAVDVGTGEEVWTWEDSTSTATMSSSPTVVDGVLYIGYENSFVPRLFAIKAEGDGSSEGSRVGLGTLGHHGDWTGEDPGMWPPIDPGTIAGTVTGGGEPLADVTVEIQDAGTVVKTVTTDATGTYEIAVFPGSYDVVVEELGFESFSEAATVEENTETTVDVNLVALDPGTVSGAVTDEEDGAPLADVDIVCTFEEEVIGTATTGGEACTRLISRRPPTT